jgi:biotin carboxyl carrier protein
MIDYVVTYNDKSNEVKFLDNELIIIDGIKKNYHLTELENNKYLLKVDNKIYDASLISNSNGNVEIFINNKTYKISVLTSLQEKALKLIQESEVSKSHQTNVKSPMPGLVLKINKNVGDKVLKGETILVLEAMKMENEIKSPVDGQISELNIKPGLAIEKNILLFSIK